MKTPQFDKAYAECLDDAGRVTRLEPLYELTKQLEMERELLLAVARAAKQYAGTILECCMTGECTGEVCDLHRALQALRAMRKVEL